MASALHIDWGASQFLSKQFHVNPQTGHELSAVLGFTYPRPATCSRWATYRVISNLKGYWDFDAQNRADGLERVVDFLTLAGRAEKVQRTKPLAR